MSALDEAIEKYATIVEDKIHNVEQAKKKLDKLIELQKLKMKRLNGEKLSEDEIRKVMTVLCWDNLAYCCAPYKECPWQQSVCDVLGLDPKEVANVKKNAIANLLKKKVM